MLIGTATTRKQALAWLSAADPEVVVQRLPRHLGQLEGTGRPVFLGGRCGRWRSRWAHVIDAEVTRSQPRSLLSMARLNSAVARATPNAALPG
jgi:hypothetical protein